MNAALRNVMDVDPAATSMKGPLITSVIFHIVILVASAITIPFIAKDTITIATPISIELVDINEITQSKPAKPKETKPKPKPVPIEPPKEIPKPKPPEIKKPEPVKETPDPVPPPEPAKKVEPEKPKPKPKVKDKPKPKPEPQEDRLASLLNDLTQHDETAEAETRDDEGTEEQGTIGEASRLSISELDALRRQIEPCWNIQSGSKYAENLAVKVRLLLNPDGTLNQASVLDKGRYNRDAAFRAAADSALRAVRNPRCSPLRLPPEKYNEWKNTVINFDPRDML